MDSTITVHRLSNNPTAAWKDIYNKQRVIDVTMKRPKNEVAPDMVRLVCMSDTHSRTAQIKFKVPDGDIFIHAGDFTKIGRLEEVVEFNDWLGKLPHRHKLVIAGNHEFSFDDSATPPFWANISSPSTRQSVSTEQSENADQATIHDDLPPSKVRAALTNCTYLQDEAVNVWGLRFYGTPWQPEFGKWAFNLPRGQACLDKWNLIPAGVDVLITHGPPLGHGDLTRSGERAGCVELLSTVRHRVRPKYHVFGHIHEGYGVTADGRATYVNASTCDINYQPKNAPIVFDMPLPPGQQKTAVESNKNRDNLNEGRCSCC